MPPSCPHRPAGEARHPPATPPGCASRRPLCGPGGPAPRAFSRFSVKGERITLPQAAPETPDRGGLIRRGRDLMPAVSMMRQTMDGQAEALAGILGDEAPVIAVAERLRGRRVLAIGTGTSWHAASQAATLLRAAGLDASAAPSADAAVDGPLPGAGGALPAFTPPRAKRYTAQAAQRARSRGAQVIQVSGVGIEGADLVTVERERSSAYPASHL